MSTTKGSANYIRRYYGVPAKRGGRILFQGNPAVITGYRDAYLVVRLDGDKHPIAIHPTWEVEYLAS